MCGILHLPLIPSLENILASLLTSRTCYRSILSQCVRTFVSFKRVIWRTRYF